MRKLLPYEYALISELGITEEEYFTFRKAQQEYKDPKVGTILDARNGLEVGTVALILSIVGTLTSVAGALLAPRPEAPDAAGGGDRRIRDRRFAPRSGFDSLQELSQYGAPVNLIYANQGTSSDENPNGGIRASTSLLWSAVYSFGNTQYLQMLGALGAGEIVDVDYDLTAVGQTLIRAFRGGSNAPRGIASVWQYFRNSGPILKGDLKNGSPEDPLLVGTASSTTVYDAVIDPTVRRQGFSQAFSPSSTSEFGISSPVPIKVNIYARRDDGTVNKRPVRISAEPRGPFWPNFYGGNRPQFPVGYRLTVSIATVRDQRNEAESDDLADEIRNAAAESFDPSALYKLGSATFRVFAISGDSELSRGPLFVTLECVESGCGPYEDYETEDVQEEEEELNTQLRAIKRNLDPTIPGTPAFNLNNLDVGSFLPSGLSAKQTRLLDRIRDAEDNVEDLYEAVVSFRRNRREIDELVLSQASSFDPVVVSFATEVDRLESDLETLRSKKERINARIESDGFNFDRERRLQEVNQQIKDLKKNLKGVRNRLGKAIEEFGVADGVVATQVRAAQDLIRSVRDSLRAEGFSGLAGIKIPDFLQSVPSSPKARFERRALRKLVVLFNTLAVRVAGSFGADLSAFETEKARLTALVEAERRKLADLEARLSSPQSFNDYLGVKGLVRINEARYETLSPCNLIHFSIKAKAFLRVQGRASRYGETDVKRFRDSDNGNKFRTAMFFVSYKKVGQPDSAFRSPNVIFCVRRSVDRDVFIPLVFRSPDADGQAKWEFKFTPVYDAPSESVRRGAALNFIYLEARGSYQAVPGQPFFYKGYTRGPGVTNLPPKNKTPRDVDEWTVFSVRSDTVLQFSFDSGPEFNIVAVSEQQFENLSSFPSLYRNIATLGLNAYSGVGLTSMRNLSAFVRKGKRVRKIRLSPPSYPSSPDGPSCWAPDIFLDTILDQDNGIRAFVDANNVENIDIGKLALSKAFCIKQRYFMDGVIADQRPWREFWSEVAPYSLLELAKIGGKETLIPAVPTLGDGTITRNVTISALFNQGNIIEDTYREEFIDYGEATQDLVASVIYREQSTTEPFPRNRSVTIKIKGVNEQLATRRSFDLSAFVTNRTQAINYGMLLVQQRRNVRRAVEFKTFPTEAPVAPGSYIYVQMEDNQWDNIRSGAVMQDGSLNIPFANETVSGSFDTLIYTPGQAVRRQTISYTNGQSSVLAALRGTGTLFVLGTQITAKRVFRVMEVAMEEEGEVAIRAMEYPCVEEGGQTKSLIARFDEGLYDIS